MRVNIYTGNKELRYIQPFTPVFKNRLFHFYHGVPGLVRRVAPDIVHVAEEPFMPVCWQFLSALTDVGNIRLNIAGVGEARYVQRIGRLALDLGLSDRVVFHGHVSRESIPEFLRRMHVLVLPSLTTPVWKEQFGRVLIEAMAARVAVVGSDSGEIKHVLGCGTGLVFREGDAGDLREKLSLLIATPGRFESLVNNGYAKAASSYTNDAIAGAIHGIYVSLLQ